MIQQNPPGTYILIIELSDRRTTEVGSLDKITFEKGYYLYVGSALAGLRSRLERHLRTEKHIHWHIDYLLQHARIREIWHHLGPERHECAWARALQNTPQVEPSKSPFGASDCGCHTHLFFSKNAPCFEAFQAILQGETSLRKLEISSEDRLGVGL